MVGLMLWSRWDSLPPFVAIESSAVVVVVVVVAPAVAVVVTPVDPSEAIAPDPNPCPNPVPVSCRRCASRSTNKIISTPNRALSNPGSYFGLAMPLVSLAPLRVGSRRGFSTGIARRSQAPSATTYRGVGGGGSGVRGEDKGWEAGVRVGG